MDKALELGCKKTRFALLWMNLSTEPLTALYSLIPFILRSELQANIFQIALFTMLSPVLSVFSFYWSSYFFYRQRKLVPNLIGTWTLARIPFLFFPWMHHFWLFLIASMIYQIFSRASAPALMEILNQNLPKKTRQRVFSLYYALSVVEGVILGILLLKFFKISESNWRLVFFLLSLISLSSIFFQKRIIPRREEQIVGDQVSPTRFLSKLHLITKMEFQKSIKDSILRPLRESFELLRRRPDFAFFQWIFMLGGLSLMIIAPIRSIFLADYTATSIGDLAIARCVFLGVGMAGSSLFWQKSLDKFGLKTTMFWILIGFALYPFLFFLTQYHLGWLYVAHFTYGVAQAGSHLIWHLSGTFFAQNENSTPFTTVNLLMIGIRGAIGPFLGALLSLVFDAGSVLFLGSLMALSSAFYLAWQSKRKALSQL